MKSIAHFLENEGLYSKVEVDENNYSDLDEFYRGYGQIEVYCPQCEKDRIFKRPTTYGISDRQGKNAFNELFKYRPQIEQYDFECTNDSFHELYYIVMCHEVGKKILN